ncbi:MAG: hypothetical protein JNK29_01530 [Anaerolineales bacterium]|nr:hypothetical protein [Anaerolineales bacterium]
MSWLDHVNADPLPWLLEPEAPSIRYFALVDLLDRPPDDPEVLAARRAIDASRPVQAILAAQHAEGYWVKPGPGYSPKYRATVWQVIFLDQLGVDGNEARLRAGCEYVLAHTQAANGGFGASGQTHAPRAPNSSVLHCLNGNLLRALLDFGYAGDERVRRAVDWQARSITGSGFADYVPAGTTGPGFRCAVNAGQPCAWGAVKALRALVRVPARARTRLVQQALQAGAEFLLSRDPAQANYPAGDGRVSAKWFKLGFPSGYVADVLQTLEALAEMGFGRDPRLGPALTWLLAKQDARGRWKNQAAYAGKLWAEIEPQGGISKWVTLRAGRVLKAAFGR